MNKKRYIRILSVVILFVTLLTFGFSYYTDYKVQQVKAEGGVSLKLSGDEGIAHTSQEGYKVIKGGIGWYKNGTEARVSATVRNGYTFTGWFDGTQNVSSNRDYNFNIRKATELVAKTSINKYKITAELNGGTVNGSTSWSTTYTIKDTVTLPTPVKTGYNFLGWVEKGTNGTPNKNVVIPVGSTGDKTYVAKWEIKKFEVDINGILDGGAVQENTRGMGTFEIYVNGVLAIRDTYYDYCNRAVPYGTEIEIKNIKAETGRTYVKSSQSLKFTVTGNVSMTLQFKTNEYTYRFNANGGTGSMSDIKVKHGTSVKIPTSTFKKDYYTQADWNTVAGGTGTKYALGGTISGYSGKDGDVVTLYARWRKNKVSISYHTNKSKMNSLAGADYGIDSEDYVTRGGERCVYSADFDSYMLNSTNSLLDVTYVGGLYLERTGYSIEKATAWNTRADGTGKSFSQDGGILAKEFADAKDGDKLVVLYANWKPNNYKVRYNGNGATSGTMTDSSHVYDTSKVLTRNAYARTGYTFTGWNTKSDGKGTAYADGASVKNLTANKGGVVTLYAQWKANSYTLTYDANGGTVSPSSKKLDYNEAYGTLPTPVRKGYRFEGWYTAITGGTKVSSITKMGTKDTTIYARWTVNTLTINYHAEGAQTFKDLDLSTGKELGDISVSGKDVFKTYTMTYNGKLSSFGVGDVDRLKKEGYSLKGDDSSHWYMKDKSGVLSIAVNDDRVAYTAIQLATLAGKQTAFETGNITIDLYPKWTVNTYSNRVDHWAWGFSNQEGNNWNKTAYRINTTYFDAVFGTTFTMDGSKQTTLPKGFHLQNKFGTSATDGTWNTYPLGTKVTQGAKSVGFEYDYYPTTYKITYNLNGGTNNSANPSTYNILYGVSLKNPTRTGYTFDGWYKGGTKVTGINEGKTAWFTSADNLYQELASRKTGNITLEARWTLNKYTLSFNPNGGTVNPTSKTVSYGNPYGNLPTPTKKGSRFLGWFTEKDGGTQVSSTTTMGASNVTLYAHWNSIEYTVSFNASGEFGGLNKTYTSGQVLGLLPTPTKAGYTFLGWYYQDTSGNEVMATSQTVVTSHMELYARWEKVQEGDCTITITDNLTSGRGEYSVKINNGVAKEYSAGESFTCNKGDKIEVNACVPDLGAEPDLFDCTGPNGNSLMSGYTWRKVNRNTSILTGTVDKTGYISFYYRIIFAEEVIE